MKLAVTARTRTRSWNASFIRAFQALRESPSADRSEPPQCASKTTKFVAVLWQFRSTELRRPAILSP
jgi:hypothetical protein